MKKEIKKEDRMDKIVSLAKRRGFVFPGSEIYGGLANSYDFGPLGIELKNNIKKLWWKTFVQERGDIVGLDSTIIMNPKVWEASGHIEGFHDPLVEDKKTHERYRLDHLLEENGIDVSGMSLEEMSVKIKDEGIKSPNGNELADPKQFNMMFKTSIGSAEDSSSEAYLRPETAQGMFVDFKQILESSRMRVPFGVAQIGKAFRNEITTGNFIFRLREFEQMEIEYFIKKDDWENHFEKWIDSMKKWIKAIGLDESKIFYHEISRDDLAHYSKRTIDIEYEYPFGQKELYGLAYRTDFDLKAHQEKSGKDLSFQDPITGDKYIPHVIEPSWGLDRTFLAVMDSAYSEVEARSGKDDTIHEKEIVLRLPKPLAPYKVAILPLSKKENLTSLAIDITSDLRKEFMVDYDETQSIGKRYRRQDEIGTPYCVTVDFDSLEDKKVTVRDRDTMEQDRVAISDLKDYVKDKMSEE